MLLLNIKKENSIYFCNFFLLLFLFLNSQNLMANDWYVRPLSDGYGLNDGSNYDNAFNGLENIIWGGDGFQAGDKLIVCGIHVNQIQAGVALGTEKLIPIISGTSENTRTIVTGNCENDHGTIWGAGAFDHQPWVDEGNGIWSIYPPTPISGDFLVQDFDLTGARQHVVLRKYDSLQQLHDSTGGYWSTSFWTNPIEKIFVKTTDGNPPDNRIASSWFGYFFDMSNRQYITFENINLFAAPIGIGSFAANMHHITWDNVDVKYISAFHFFDGMHDIKILNSEISWTSEPIYNITTTNDGPYNYEYTGNYIHDIGFRPNNPEPFGGDNHCIAIQGGHNGIIKNNVLQRCSSGITLYSYLDQDMQGIEIAYNFISDMSADYGGGNGRGIETSTDYKAHGNRSNISIHHNIVSNCTIGIRNRLEWDKQLIHNNIINNCDYGIVETGNLPLVLYKDDALISQGVFNGDVLVGTQSGGAIMIRGGLREDHVLTGSLGSFSYNQLYVLNFINGNTEPVLGNWLNGSSSGATGIIRKIQLTSGSWGLNNAAGIIYMDKVNGQFSNNEILNIHEGAANSLQINGDIVSPINFEVGERLTKDGTEVTTFMEFITSRPFADIQNNLVMNSNIKHISLICAEGNYCPSVINHNLYYPDGDGMFSHTGNEWNFTQWHANTNFGLGSTTLAPTFEDATGNFSSVAEYTPLLDSPVVNSGINLSYPYDINGNPIDAQADIGAIEYQTAIDLIFRESFE